MEDKFLVEYYQRYDENNRLESKHQRIEFLTTVKYVEKYLKDNDKILEVGAGTGRYSLYFARAGYNVTSIELVEHNIEVFRSNMTIDDKVNLQQGNALDLSRFKDNTFDVTLVLGPMYHMYNEQDKRKCLGEALRVTKENGIVVIAYITHDAVIVNWGLINKNLTKHNVDTMFADNYRCISTPKEVFAMFHIDEFNEYMDELPVDHLHTVATDGLAPMFRELFNEIDDEVYNEWLKYHFATCERKDLIGFSSHIIYIGKKKTAE